MPPIPDNFLGPILPWLTQSGSIEKIDDSPFGLIKANQLIESKIFLTDFVGINVQRWFFREPCQYTLKAEFANKYPTYVDLETHEVKLVDNAFFQCKSTTVKYQFSGYGKSFLSAIWQSYYFRLGY